MKALVHTATPEALEPLGRLLEERFGLRLTLGNRDLIEGGLRLLGAELNLPEGVLLRRLLAGEESLLHRLAVKTVVSETYFFRHPEHFDLLAERLVPALLQEGRTTLRAWSAGCATGEEAYSLAAALLAAAPRADIAVLGTDLSEDSLAIAATGRYGRRALRSELPRWSLGCPLQVGPRSVEVPAALRAITRFQPLNLHKECYPEEVVPASSFDIIFCRNVLIYFSPEGAASVLLRLRDRLREGGYLILAALDYTAALPGLVPLHLDGIPVLRRQSAVHKAAAPSRRTPPKRTPTDIKPTDIKPADIKKEARAGADCGDYELAARVIRDALRTQRAPELLHLLALVHKERGQFHDSLALLGEAAVTDPEYVLGHLSLGLSMLEFPMRDPARARHHLERVRLLLYGRSDTDLLPGPEPLTVGLARSLALAGLRLLPEET